MNGASGAENFRFNPITDSPDVKARIPAQFEQASDFLLLIPEKDSLRLNAIGEV
jgi:hypothetical protein